MMLNVNAACLASELSKQYYFEKDVKGLVWDRNKPCEVKESIHIPFLVTSKGVVADVRVTLLEKEVVKNAVNAEMYINDKHNRGLHLICGSSSHSLLVAGIKDKSYFVWDPDTSWCNNEIDLINKNLSGEHTIPWLYEQYANCDEIEFWVYKVEVCT